MTNWKWLARQAVEIIHAEQLAEHGGLQGLKDENALEASLARPQNKAAYGSPDVHELAAAYLFAFVRNHPFSDGNKRTGYLLAYTFLQRHGVEIEASQGEVVEVVLSVASGDIEEVGVAQFLRDHSIAI